MKHHLDIYKHILCVLGLGTFTFSLEGAALCFESSGIACRLVLCFLPYIVSHLYADSRSPDSFARPVVLFRHPPSLITVNVSQQHAWSFAFTLLSQCGSGLS